MAHDSKSLSSDSVVPGGVPASAPPTDDPVWKQFELVVAAIEKTLSGPVGAKVRSPDYVLDQITGQRREIDATIRFNRAGQECLITVECRDRTGVQDVTWIEQLVTKRVSIGAMRTIAVSSTGFTERARALAHHYGIVLRDANKITHDDVAAWITVTEVQLFRVFVVYQAVEVEFADDPNIHLTVQVTHELRMRPKDAPIFIGPADSRLTPDDILFDPRTDQKELWEGLSEEGDIVNRSLRVDVGERGLAVPGELGLAPVRAVVLKLGVSRFRKILPAEMIRSYRSGREHLIDVLEFNVSLSGQARRLLVCHDARTGTGWFELVKDDPLANSPQTRIVANVIEYPAPPPK